MSRWELILVLGLLSAIVPMSVDMYLPALPAMARDLAGSEGDVQLTLSAFFIGGALGQVFYGPFLDRFGRRAPVYCGLALFTIASIGCGLAQSAAAMTVWRFFQAIGSFGGQVSSRAIVRDRFQPHEAARIYSMLFMVNGMAPILAPMLGGYLVVWTGWRAIFWCFAAVGTILGVVVVWRLRETRPGDSRVSLSIVPVLRTYAGFLRHPQFLVEASVSGISTAGMFAYIAGSPFVFIEFYHVPTEFYGLMFGINSIGIVLMSQVNAQLLKRRSPDWVQTLLLRIQAVAGLAMLADVLTGFGGLIGVAVPLWVYLACIGGVVANASALALASHGERAGSASALLGTMQFVIAAFIASLVGGLHVASALPMAAIIATCGIGCAGLRTVAAPRIHQR